MTEVLYASTTRHEEWLGPKRYVCIVIHDTVEQFRDACKRYSYNDSSGSWEGAVGAFHPVDRREKYSKTKKRWINTTPKHFAGVVRLCREWCTGEVIVHEVVHAACHIFRLDVAKRVNLGTNCHQNEEWFAYIVGDLTESVTEKLTDGGIWTLSTTI